MVSAARAPKAARPPPELALVASLPALLLVVKTVLAARAAQGDEFLAAAASSAAAIDLADVLRAAPTPTLAPVQPAYHGRLYAAALARRPSVFDVAGTTVTLDVFVDRLLNYGDVSEAVLLVALVYLDRLLAATTDVVLNAANVHKLFGVAFMLAAKWHEDEYYAPAFFARLIGLSLDEVNELERTFLAALSYNLFVDPRHFEHAEVVFMGEAIDSPTGLSVYQRLRTLRVHGLEEAADRATTWHVVPAADLTWRVVEEFRALVSPSSVRVEHGPPECPAPPFLPLPPQKPGPPTLAPLQSSAPLAAIARAQLENDFPNFGCGGVWLPDAGRVYTPAALRRRQALLLLSQGVPANTWLPQLEYREIPHAYLSHVMPVDHHALPSSDEYLSPVTASYTESPYAFREKHHVVPEPAYNDNDFVIADIPAGWNADSKVDWGYCSGQTGTLVGGIGSIYAVPTIWTTR